METEEQIVAHFHRKKMKLRIECQIINHYFDRVHLTSTPYLFRLINPRKRWEKLDRNTKIIDKLTRWWNEYDK